MSSQLSRQYCPPLQNAGTPTTNTPKKNQEKLPADGGRGELLVKQTYWDYDDFMNKRIRNPPKKCYYEMVSRDEFNIRHDLCKGLEMKRNNIIEKIERDTQAPEQDLPPYPDLPNARYGGPPQMPVGDMEQSLPTSQLHSQLYPQPLPRREGVMRPVDCDNGIPPQQRQNQNPRPRSLPYHMRSSANFEPRPGPGVVLQTSPANQVSNAYYSYMNSPVTPPVNRVKSPSYRPQAPNQISNDIYDLYSNNHTNDNTTREDIDNDNKICSVNNNDDKYYEQPKVRQKTVQQFLPAPNATGSHHYLPTQSLRYQYPPVLAEPEAEDVRPTPALAQYEKNNQECSGIPLTAYSESKTNCKLNQCSSSCSCCSRENSKTTNKMNIRYQNQSTPPRQESERQYRLPSPDNEHVQYDLKLDSAMEQCHSPPQQCSPHEPERLYNGIIQSVPKGSMPSQYGCSKVSQKQHYTSSAGSRQSVGPVQNNKSMGLNVKVRIPKTSGMVQVQNYQYPSQTRNKCSSMNVQQSLQPQSQVVTAQQTNLLQTGQQQYGLSSTLTGQQQQSTQTQSSAEMRNFSMPPSEPIKSEIHEDQHTEGYNEYNMDFERHSSYNNHAYGPKSTLEPKRQPPVKYNWPVSQPQCDNGDVWNNSIPSEFCCSDTDNCDLEECDEDDSW